MREQKEADILRDCLTWLKLHGVFCWRQNQGAIAGEYNGKRRFLRFTSMAGVSDILGVLPPTGRLLAIECKRPGRKPTPEQEAFLDIVRHCGGVAFCVHSTIELEEALRAMIAPPGISHTA
ncbi:MAG: VRR-NUC domain-containing protein [Gemmataceae bacterium]|nr:VRR-NUC domain-containing protein [Gemmataceae bacterium]